ncbi:Trimethylguanosine synthase [Seminavis robusta]|uniref:Trimethylguanosine synthase n=1 Tax=Seminavis robusta TaxID=568900 RepID=A0A9N8EZW9_9STRA|nr:Trimethylguanosine synthase [Seminavis robusta]|eukprot:Sro2758_g336360.1 Trimethylguanosine synthase (518) ;mRNA; r:3879-5534
MTGAARSRSPNGGRSRSPKGCGKNNRNKHHNANSNDLHHHYNPKKDGPPDITVVVNRVDLYDSAAHIVAVAVDGPNQHPAPPYPVQPFNFDKNRHAKSINKRKFADCLVAIQRVPYSVKYVPCEDLLATHETVPLPPRAHSPLPPHGESVVDNTTPNPYDKSIDKYWAQRRRLFAKFDQGIQLDSEGWYSVTPEIIADHVAHRVGDLAASSSTTGGWVVLDAFCGCGGNGIAFSKVPADRISLVICVDTDRNKLRMAAHNAALYHIPPSQIVFVECNSIFILKHCYRNGEFILDQPDLLIQAGATPPQLPSPVHTEVYEGYHIGGINMLPRRIDVVFMDPPWGGVDYEVLGKNGYDLEKNMKIRCQVCLEPDEKDTIKDDFFDSFATQPANTHHKSGKAKKKANFNNNIVDDYVNGADMLKYAAAATSTRLVLYDLPRNTNKTSLGQSALAAGYRGNLKLEEHFLNGRLKTVTAYFGTDFSKLLDSTETNQAELHQPASPYPTTDQSDDDEADNEKE